MNKKASLGAVVRDRRLALGYSLGQLATKVNKTAASIRSWERGDSFPAIEDTELLGAALDLDAEFLSGLLPAARPADGAKPPIEADSLSDEPAAAAVKDPWEGPDQALAATSVDPEPVEAEAVAPRAAESAQQPISSDDEESDEGFDEVTEGGEALTEVIAELTAVSPTDDVDEGGAATEASAAGEMEAAATVAAAPIEGGAVAHGPELHEAMTEAVPVVPAASVAVADAPATSAVRPKLMDSFAARGAVNPVLRTWDSVLEWYRRIFDPRRKWIYRVRFVLLLIALYILLRVLVWAAGELWDAIGDVLDGIAFSPSDTPDIAN